MSSPSIKSGGKSPTKVHPMADNSTGINPEPGELEDEPDDMLDNTLPEVNIVGQTTVNHEQHMHAKVDRKRTLNWSMSFLEVKNSVWQIIRENLVYELRHLVETVPDTITAKDNAGNYPMHIAAKYDKVQCLKILLEFKAEPNVVGPYEMYPLHLAARYNSVSCASILLHHRADIMCRDCKNKTPLHHAARKGHMKMIQMLTASKGCEIDALDEDNLTPLHESIMLKQETAALYLIEHGASINARDINDNNPLLFAAGEGLMRVIELLLDRVVAMQGSAGKATMVKHVDNEGTSALHLAVLNDKLQAAQFLLDNGADVNLQNNTNSSPLHMAVINGSTEMTKLLLDKRSLLESRDSEHMTPLHRAAMYDKTEVIKQLLGRGASVNAKTSEQMSPLLVAAWKGHLATIELLLNLGAKITDTDSSMRTALHWCVDQSHYQALVALLKHGGTKIMACIDQIDQSVQHYAARTGNTLIMKTLIEHAAKLDVRDQEGRTPIHIAAEFGNYECIELLCEASNTETNDADSDGRTPLMLAAIHGQYKAARSLLALGADSAIRDEDMCTALMLACSKGHTNVAKVLIENLAEVNLTDKLKNSSLHMAAAGGNSNTVILLLDSYATPTLLNHYKKTPLDMALDYDQVDVAVTMMKHKKWKEIMSVRDDECHSPMKRLIKKAPEAAQIVMDNCVKETDHKKDDLQYNVNYDFVYMDPGPLDPSCQSKRYFALNTMVEFNREELLSHPLTQSLLIMKWKKFGRWILYCNLAIYCIYVGVLTVYMGLNPIIRTNLIDHVRQCPVYLTEEQRNNATLVNEYLTEGSMSQSLIESEFLHVLQLMLDVAICLLFVKELFLFIGQKWRYFLNPYTYISWSMMISTTIFLNPPKYIPCESNWRGAWISIMCAWTLLISYLQKLDIIGIYFVMFSEVVTSLMKVSFVLVIFLMSFGQAFAVILGQVAGFGENDPFPLTVLSMMLGEIGFVDNFVSANNYPFTIDAYIVITLFMLIVPVALMNLLVGIAVGDIDKIQKQAYIKRLALQIEQLTDGENRLPKILQRRLYQRSFTIYPNVEKYTKWARFKLHVFGIQTSSDFIAKSEKDFTVETLQDIQRRVARNKQQLSKIAYQQRAQRNLLESLCQHFHIELQGRADNISVTYSDRTELLQSRLEP